MYSRALGKRCSGRCSGSHWRSQSKHDLQIVFSFRDEVAGRITFLSCRKPTSHFCINYREWWLKPTITWDALGHRTKSGSSRSPPSAIARGRDGSWLNMCRARRGFQFVVQIEISFSPAIWTSHDCERHCNSSSPLCVTACVRSRASTIGTHHEWGQDLSTLRVHAG